jgi:hypothetical protein
VLSSDPPTEGQTLELLRRIEDGEAEAWTELYRRYHDELLAVRPDRPEPAFALAWIHAGARRGECEECDALYAEHPELYDPDRAERYALQSLRHGRGRNAGRVAALVSVAKKIGRSRAITALMKAIKAEAYERGDDERAARLDRVLFRLARLPE